MSIVTHQHEGPANGIAVASDKSGGVGARDSIMTVAVEIVCVLAHIAR
jgi:hypothetical protein